MGFGASVLVLFFCMISAFGNYFMYDNPAALMSRFEAIICGGSTVRYLMLYSVYSIPNTVQPFFGGYLTDVVFGKRCALLVFTSFSLAGSLVLWLSSLAAPVAGWQLAFYLALAGRFLYALGGECAMVVVNSIIAKWFKGRRLATAFTINICFGRFGSAANFLLLPVVAAKAGFSCALGVSSVLAAISLSGSVGLWFMDWRAERAGQLEPSAAASDATDAVSLKDIGKVLGVRELLIYVITGTFYIPIMTFLTLAAKYFEAVSGLSPEAATSLCAVPFTISAVLSPLCGCFADAAGRPVLIVMLSSCGLALAHMLLGMGLLPPFLAVSVIGCMFSLNTATLWPMISLVVPQELIGTVYGIMIATQNTFLSVAPMLIGWLGTVLADGDDRKMVIIAQRIFTATAFIAVICSALLMLIDRQIGGELLATPAELARITALRRSRRVGGRAELLSAAKSPTSSPMSTPGSLMPPSTRDAFALNEPLLPEQEQEETSPGIVLTTQFD